MAPQEFGYYEPPAAGGSGRPAVILWYRVFCICSVLAMAAFLATWQFLTPDDAMHPHSTPHDLYVMALVCAPFAVFNGFAAFVPTKPWGWVFGIVALAFGIMSCLALPSIVLLVFWVRPETQAAFGRFSPR